MSEDLRYPIGRPVKKDLTDAERAEAIDKIAETPARFRQALAGLTPEQLDTPYRPEGWTVRQLAHHVPDSHLNAYIRSKLALTEDEPTIKTYEENLWAELPDTRNTPVEVSLNLLEAIHTRLDNLLRSLSPDDFRRPMNHPEQGRITIDHLLCIYSWHGPHHVAHVTKLRERMGW